MRPDSGEILYDGRDLTSMDKHELNMLRREWVCCSKDRPYSTA